MMTFTACCEGREEGVDEEAALLALLEDFFGGWLEDVEGLEDAERAEDVEGLEDAEGVEDVEGLEDVEGVEDVEGAEDVEGVDDVEDVEDVVGCTFVDVVDVTICVTELFFEETVCGGDVEGSFTEDNWARIPL